ncbi:MAG: hypothetical protein AAGI68_00835 [Planctomycetota bacterium]
MTERRLGQILIARGLINESQVQQILDEQAGLEDPPRFGVLARQRFDLSHDDVLSALTELHLRRSPQTSLATERFDAQCLRLLTAEQAWDSLVLPLRTEGEELVCATTLETLGSAIEMMEAKTDLAFRFVIVEICQLEQFIAERYAYEGIAVIEEAA